MCIPRSTSDWVRYFTNNGQNLLPVEWEIRERLSLSDVGVIGRSLRVFQLGESSEGKSLMRYTKEFAETHGDPMMEEAMAKFIAEETRHANWLGRFMDQEGIPRATRNWTDHVFRYLRRAANLEISIAVLLTAELVARAYYHALYFATSSSVLRQICRQLLRDEIFHVYFHTHLLKLIHKGRGRIATAMWKILYMAFHGVTVLVVWIGHHRVLQKGHFSFARYWKTSRRYCNHALLLIAKQAGHTNKKKMEWRDLWELPNL